MASDGIAYRIFIPNEQLGQAAVPCVPDYRKWCVYTTKFCTRLNGEGDRGIAAENMEKSQHADFNEDSKIRLMKA